MSDPIQVVARGAPRRLVLSPHDPSWNLRFEEEASTIRLALGADVVAVEHIGSTSVPGLIAKPIIDVLVGLCSVPPSQPAIERMEALGYQSLGEYGLPERHYFWRPGVHVHGYVPGRGQWGSHLLFRDYLRHVPAAREAYAAAKLALAAHGSWDLDTYVEAKEVVVTRLLADAREWERTRA